MSLLTTVQRFCERTNLTRPATVYGSSDPQIVQIKALLEELGIDANSRGSWERTVFQATHTTIAAEDQGAIADIATNGFSYIKNQTIWDFTDRLPVLGPLDGVDWQTLKAFQVNGPRYNHRIRGGQLLVNPVPAAGHDWRFEYASKNWILGDDEVTYKEYFTDDNDEILLPESVVLQGLRAWWKKEKGLDYAEDMRMYETQIKDSLSRNAGKPVLRMDESGYNGPKPGIWVPEWSWPV